MVQGRKVYDPIGKEWSTGWWIPIYQGNRIVQWVPVWRATKEV